MSKPTLAILIGGLLPAVLYGVAGVLQKTASKTGIGPGPYVLIIGVTAAVIGGVITLLLRDTSVTWSGAAQTAGFGVLWAAAVVSIMLALGKYEGPVSVIVPLYNMNTLIAVLLGLLFLNEWAGVNGWRLIAGAVLLVAGGALAGTSVK
jgi:transporter family protein